MVNRQLKRALSVLHDGRNYADTVVTNDAANRLLRYVLVRILSLFIVTSQLLLYWLLLDYYY